MKVNWTTNKFMYVNACANNDHILKITFRAILLFSACLSDIFNVYT